MRFPSFISCLLAVGTHAAVLREFDISKQMMSGLTPSAFPIKGNPLRAPEDAPLDRRDGQEAAASSYWLEDMQHQGIAAFNPNPSGYKVFRNVKDYGAVGMY